MKSSFHYFVLSLLTIGIGAGWLLNIFPKSPNVGWVWTLALGLSGLLMLALCGFNKLTIVTGPFLIIAAIFTMMRELGRFDSHQAMPSMIVTLGLLMLVSVLAPVPAPGWANAQSGG